MTVQCSIPVRMVPLIRYEWRCPTSIAMMQESGKMFIPWPDYEDGKSKDLTKGIDKLQDEFKDK